MTLRPIALGAVLLTAGPLGCFVMDELDQGRKQMERPSFSAPAPEAKTRRPQVSPDDGAGAGAGSVEDASAAWWRSSRSLDTGELDAAFVRCDLGGASSFMLESDCRARGGRPARDR